MFSAIAAGFLGANAAEKSFCIAGFAFACVTTSCIGLGALTPAIAPIGCVFGTATGGFGAGANGKPLLTGNQLEIYPGFAQVFVDIIGASVCALRSSADSSCLTIGIAG